MSPPRLCVDETCTVRPSYDEESGQLILDVPLDPVGGIDCDDDDGLFVERVGMHGPVAAASVDVSDIGCDHAVSITDDGQLWVRPKPIRAAGRGAGVPVDYTTTGVDHLSASLVVTNPFDCPVLARFVAGQLNLITRTHVASALATGVAGITTAYRQGTAFIDSTVADINGSNRISTRTDRHHHLTAADDDREIQDRYQLQIAIPLAPLQATTIEVGVNHSTIAGFRTAQVNGANFNVQRMWVEHFRAVVT